MIIVWAPRALLDLDETLAYLAERSVQGASNVSIAIERSIDICARYPHLGIPTDEPLIYRWPVGPYRYTFFLRILLENKGIEVVRLRRAARLSKLGALPRD